MSFLGSIVARAAGIAPVVQPRLPSRYESDAYEPAEERAESYPATPAAAGAPSTTASVMAPRQHRVSPPALDDAPRSTVEHRIEEHERVAHGSASPPPASPMPRPAAPIEIRQVAPPERTTRIESHERTHESHVTHHEVIEPPPLRMLLEPRVTSHHQHTHLTSPQSSPSLGPRIVRERVQTPAAAPTIRVTIGRVDVRAISAPAPAKIMPLPKKPSFTLDDYIRLRKEGR
ncbi:MAG: hypothetical protein M3P06_01275 [Acidobacteriota bacterium]|nr:hypothetical protein [Acidobacteriota bacterium]